MATALNYERGREDASDRDALAQRMAGCHLLIVDDEEANVKVLTRILNRAGFTRITGLSDAREVVNTYRMTSPDLVVLDLRMPHLDGFEVLKQLRELIPPHTYLPILMITGAAASDARQQALRLGARDFLEKPFDATEVVLRIQNLLETRLLHLSLADQNVALETQVADRTRRLEAALRAAEAASRAKSDFLASMSHELRTPLNSVIGFAKVLLKNRGNAMQPQDLAYLQRIESNGSHLLELINGILDLSKVEAGKMELNLGEVALERIVYETMEQLEGRFVESKVLPRVHLPPRLVPVESDSGKLKQVLINLVGNAVKFTEEGTVSVDVVADGSGRPLRIDVTDTGIGIPRNRLAAVFDSFEQADSSTRRRFGGTGLGLAISRAMCHLMGYRLTVVSEEGQGSTFSVILSPDAEVPTEYTSVPASLRTPTLVRTMPSTTAPAATVEPLHTDPPQLGLVS